MTVLRFFMRPRDEPARHGLWVMHPDGRGDFYHGDREEMQGSRYSLETLIASGWETSQDEALANLATWPEAAAHLRKMIDRFPAQSDMKDAP